MRSIVKPGLVVASSLVALAGCGSGTTRTVSVSGATGAASTASPTAGASTSSPAAPGGTTTTGSGTPSPPPAQTRTATAPAFAEHGGSAAGQAVEQAAALVRSHGYTPEQTSQYRPEQTLRVLVGTRTGSGDGYAQQAFFFVDERYIGTDASSPSAGLAVVSQSDTEVTLGYRLYLPGDPLCCARGGQADVRFQLDNGRLSALDPIPPVQSRTAASRR